MADTSVKLSGTYDSIEAYNILEEIRNMSSDYEEIRTEAAAAASAATAAVATAQTAVTNATTASNNAQTYAGNANDSATAAAGSASTASTAAGNALNSETAAAGSASAASASETNAAASETAAAASAAEAAATLSSKAPLNSPAFTGTPTVPTASSSDDSTQVANTEWIDDVFLDKVFAKLQTTGALPTGASFPAASVLSKMIANMNTEDGVRYNFSNANAWYICLGAKYGGLIIQGGYANNNDTVTLPITYSGKYYSKSVIHHGDSADTNFIVDFNSMTPSSFKVKRNNSAGIYYSWFTAGK